MRGGLKWNARGLEMSGGVTRQAEVRLLVPMSVPSAPDALVGRIIILPIVNIYPPYSENVSFQ